MAHRARMSMAVGAAVIAVAGAAMDLTPASASSTTSVTVKATGSFAVTYRGNGHGHGLSQYGAYGAALAGRSYPQILSSYYHGTALTTVKPTHIRVLLSGTGKTTTVQAFPGIRVTGVSGYLPVNGVHRYRLIADSGTGLTLQRLMLNSTRWTTVKAHLPNGAWFYRAVGQGLRLLHPDQTSTYYFSYLRAYRNSVRGSSAGVYTVNRGGLEHYTAGVTPREMPSSWSRAAVSAQAVAARTYGYYYVQHPMTSTYDICDTTNCQVYGGHLRHSRSGSTLWTDDPAAAHNTDHRVLTYKGSTIFAQFSASNGGWSTSGGQPYLVAAADPYDPGGSGDPYIGARKSVTAASLAHDVGLTTVTTLTITKRDGHGTWGGRVLSAVVSGTSGKKPASRTVSGYDLQDDFGLGTTWLTVAAG